MAWRRIEDSLVNHKGPLALEPLSLGKHLPESIRVAKSLPASQGLPDLPFFPLVGVYDEK